MRKIFTLCFAVALAASANAQKISYFSCGLGVPGQDEPQLMAEALSPNAKYIAGGIDLGEGIFMIDVQTGKVKFCIPETINSVGAELRSVNDQGVAIGYCGPDGITYDFNTGEVTILEGPENTRGILGEAISNDGSLLVGSIKYDEQVAGYSRDGGEWKDLPFPAEEEMLIFFKKVPKTSSAKRVSGDGKVILGFIGNFLIPCVWTMNDNGEYMPDFFPVRFLKLTDEDLDNDERPLVGLSAHYLSLSNNGRYAVMVGIVLKDNIDVSVPMVYDIVNKSLTLYPADQEVDEDGIYGMYPTGICNDGTFIGTVGMPYFGSKGSFIMKAGQTQAEMYNDVFPDFYDRYGFSDMYGFNVPTGISADGRYISGYSYFSEDFDDEISPAYYETYIIDRGEDAAVGEVPVAGNMPETIYSIDGSKMNQLTKGINIVRHADGTVSKILKK